MDDKATFGPEKRDVADFEWSLEHLSAHYIGRRVQIPYWSVSENNTYESYVRRALYLVEAVNATDVDCDDEITFDLKYVDFDAHASDVLPISCSITRIGPPEEIITKNSHETWVYGDGSGEDDLTLEFVI